jgi:hypothetical protein
MRPLRSLLVVAAVAMSVAMSVGALAAPARAEGLAAPGHFVVACENGANYRLDAAAVTVFGEVVTGHLHMSPHHAIHVRLIPMGDGYRYAGLGVWLTGFREQAQLNLGKNVSVACLVDPI